MSQTKRDTNFVAVAILHRDNKIFVAKRADHKPSLPGVFELIGGHIELGEQPIDAVKRELVEEVGLDLDKSKFHIFEAFVYKSTTSSEPKIEICYLVELTDDIEPKINPDDHSEARWIDSTELDILEDGDEEKEVIRKAFEAIQGDK